MLAPSSASILVASLKNLGVLSISLPTATTPITGIEYLTPKLTAFDKFSKLESWPSPPIKVCTARQSAFILQASSASTASISWLKSSCTIEEPDVALRAIPLPAAKAGSTQLLIAPLVPISTSMLGNTLGIIKSSLSRPAVEPIK